MCANDVDRPVGTLVYTQMLNERRRHRGRLHRDAARRAVVSGIVTGTAFGNHDLGWLRKHLPGDGSVVLNDVSSAFACFCLWGPRARDILAAADQGRPLARGVPLHDGARALDRRRACLAARVTYVGELGWEIYCPAEYGAGLWDLLWEAGAEHGLVACGYRAIDALRLEKGYRVWGSDITPEDGPDEAGLGFAVKVDKPGGFIGRDAVVAARERGAERRLACLVLDDPRAVTLGSEPVRIGEEIVGRVTTGGYGYAVESSDRAGLPAGRPGRGGHQRPDRGVRRVGQRHGRGRAALRPEGRAHPLMNKRCLAPCIQASGGGEELAHGHRLVAPLADADDRDRHADLLLDELAGSPARPAGSSASSVMPEMSPPQPGRSSYTGWAWWKSDWWLGNSRVMVPSCSW